MLLSLSVILLLHCCFIAATNDGIIALTMSFMHELADKKGHSNIFEEQDSLKFAYEARQLLNDVSLSSLEEYISHYLPVSVIESSLFIMPTRLDEALKKAFNYDDDDVLMKIAIFLNESINNFKNQVVTDNVSSIVATQYMFLQYKNEADLLKFETSFVFSKILVYSVCGTASYLNGLIRNSSTHDIHVIMRFHDEFEWKNSRKQYGLLPLKCVFDARCDASILKNSKAMKMMKYVVLNFKTHPDVAFRLAEMIINGELSFSAVFVALDKSLNLSSLLFKLIHSSTLVYLMEGKLSPYLSISRPIHKDHHRNILYIPRHGSNDEYNYVFLHSYSNFVKKYLDEYFGIKSDMLINSNDYNFILYLLYSFRVRDVKQMGYLKPMIRAILSHAYMADNEIMKEYVMENADTLVFDALCPDAADYKDEPDYAAIADSLLKSFIKQFDNVVWKGSLEISDIGRIVASSYFLNSYNQLYDAKFLSLSHAHMKLPMYFEVDFFAPWLHGFCKMNLKTTLLILSLKSAPSASSYPMNFENIYRPNFLSSKLSFQQLSLKFIGPLDDYLVNLFLDYCLFLKASLQPITILSFSKVDPLFASRIIEIFAATVEKILFDNVDFPISELIFSCNSLRYLQFDKLDSASFTSLIQMRPVDRRLVLNIPVAFANSFLLIDCRKLKGQRFHFISGIQIDLIRMKYFDSVDVILDDQTAEDKYESRFKKTVALYQ